MFLFLFLKWCILESDCLTIAHLWSQYWFFQKWTCQVLQALSGASWNGSLQHLEFLLKTANPKKKQGPRSFPCLGWAAAELCTSESHGQILPWSPDCAFELFTFLPAPFSADLMNPTLCQEGLLVEVTGGCTWGGLIHGKVSLVGDTHGWGPVLGRFGIFQTWFVWLWFVSHVCVHPTQNIQEWTPLFLPKFGGRQQVAPFLWQERWHLSSYPISPLFFLAPVCFCVCCLSGVNLKAWTAECYESWAF